MQRKIHKYPQKSNPERWNNPLTRAYKGYINKRVGNINGGCLLSHPHKMLCVNCRKANKMVYQNETCSICDSKLYEISSRVRLPRKLASNKEWNSFLKRFCRSYFE